MLSEKSVHRKGRQQHRLRHSRQWRYNSTEPTSECGRSCWSKLCWVCWLALVFRVFLKFEQIGREGKLRNSNGIDIVQQCLCLWLMASWNKNAVKQHTLLKAEFSSLMFWENDGVCNKSIMYTTYHTHLL